MGPLCPAGEDNVRSANQFTTLRGDHVKQRGSVRETARGIEDVVQQASAEIDSETGGKAERD